MIKFRFSVIIIFLVALIWTDLSHSNVNNRLYPVVSSNQNAAFVMEMDSRLYRQSDNLIASYSRGIINIKSLDGIINTSSIIVSSITALEMSEEYPYIAIGDEFGNVCLFDHTQNQVVLKKNISDSKVIKLIFGRNRLFIACKDGTYCLMELTGSITWKRQAGNSGSYIVKVSPSGKFAFMLIPDDNPYTYKAVIYNLIEQDIVMNLGQDFLTKNLCGFSHDDSIMYYYNYQDEIVILTRNDEEFVSQQEIPAAHFVNAISFSESDNVFSVSYSQDNIHRIKWIAVSDRADYQSIISPALPLSPVWIKTAQNQKTVALIPGGILLIFDNWENPLAIRMPAEINNPQIIDCFVSDNISDEEDSSSHLFLKLSDNSILFFNTETQVIEKSFILPGHFGSVIDLAISSSEEYIFTSDYQKIVKWQSNSGEFADSFELTAHDSNPSPQIIPDYLENMSNGNSSNDDIDILADNYAQRIISDIAGQRDFISTPISEIAIPEEEHSSRYFRFSSVDDSFIYFTWKKIIFFNLDGEILREIETDIFIKDCYIIGSGSKILAITDENIILYNLSGNQMTSGVLIDENPDKWVYSALTSSLAVFIGDRFLVYDLASPVISHEISLNTILPSFNLINSTLVIDASGRYLLIKNESFSIVYNFESGHLLNDEYIWYLSSDLHYLICDDQQGNITITDTIRNNVDAVIEDLTITEIFLLDRYEDFLIAATDDGLYLYNLYEDSPEFIPFPFTSCEIENFYLDNISEIIYFNSCGTDFAFSIQFNQ